MHIELPEKVNRVISTLTEAGYEAYAVGGCVRDSILGRVPGDWDITTSASPEQVKELFLHTIDTGIQHGTVTVMLGHDGFEVTTYRIDGEYEDCRHPKEVIFTKNLEEDLKRRDFTINAMAYNDATGIVDLFGGIDDLNSKIIRCVGNAGERFDEDALRIMRAVRFAAQLGFDIDRDTFNAGKERVHNLQKVSAERIRVELTKLLLAYDTRAFHEAVDMDILSVILPECYTGDAAMCSVFQTQGIIDLCKVYEFGGAFSNLFERVPEILEKYVEHFELLDETQIAVSEAKRAEVVVFAILFATQTPENAAKLMRKLRFDNEATEGVRKTLRGYKSILAEYTAANASFETNSTTDINSGSEVKSATCSNSLPYFIRKCMSVNGADNFIMALVVAEVLDGIGTEATEKTLAISNAADNKSNNNTSSNNTSSNNTSSDTIGYDAISCALLTILRNKDPYRVSDLAINGSDLVAMGVKPGKQLGELLNKALEMVLRAPEMNTKEALITELAREVQM